MKILEVAGNKYIDQDLFDYINKIWLSYDVSVKNDSNLFFAKNTTVNKLITDYNNTGIQRVIKRDKAEYVVINRIKLSSYPQYYDGTNITSDSNGEVLYGIYNQNLENIDTIELVLDFFNKNQPVIYVNQDKLNESLNNGFVIDKDNYISIKELVDSNQDDNHRLAVSMVCGSDLKSNWKWILYLYNGNYQQIYDYDSKNIISNYIDSLNLGNTFKTLTRSIDSSIELIKDNKDIYDRFLYMIKDKFQKNINDYFASLGTSKFVLNDFKIDYDATNNTK